MYPLDGFLARMGVEISPVSIIDKGSSLSPPLVGEQPTGKSESLTAPG